MSAAADVRIRPARPDDADDLARVHIEAWRSAYRGLVPDAVLDGFSLEQRAAYWRRTIDSTAAPGAERRTWVLEIDGALAGFCSTGPSRDEPGELPEGSGEVYAIYLAPDVIGRGLGRALFAVALDDLVARDQRPIVVWVFEANERARRFYAAAGFEADGARQPVRFDEVDVPEVRYRAFDG